MYDSETDFEVCVEVKPPFNSTYCPVEFEFDLNVFVQGNKGKLLLSFFLHQTLYYPIIGSRGDQFVFAIDPCTTEKCVLLPIVDIPALDHLHITLQPPTDHNERIKLVDTQKDITFIPNIGIAPFV